MSLFSWRVLTVFSLAFLAFTIASVVATLMVVFDIRNGTPVNDTELTFVEAANFIYAGLLLLGFLAAIAGTPVLLYYRTRTETLVNTGLTPAK